MFTTWPVRRATIYGSIARVTLSTPLMFVSIILSQSSKSPSCSGARPLASPALLRSTSGTPSPRSSTSACRCTAARSRTSTCATLTESWCAARSSPAFWSPHVARVAQRVAARLRPHREPVRAALHRDPVGEPPRRRVEDVHLGVEPPRQPQLLAVGADVTHVGAAASRNRPGGHDPPGRELEHADAPRAVPPADHRVPAAVSDVQQPAVAARIQAVRAPAGVDEPDDAERGGAEQVHAV